MGVYHFYINARNAKLEALLLQDQLVLEEIAGGGEQVLKRLQYCQVSECVCKVAK